MTDNALPAALSFRAVLDEPIGSALTDIFKEYWPAYRSWLQKTKVSKGLDHRKILGDSMPELLPVFDQLLDSFGGGDDISRFLSLYNPPRVVRGCAQIVLDDAVGPVLLRSYDHHPKKIDALIIKSSWLDQSVLAMGDCIWGALDGINDRGLAVSLAFGGRNTIGPGFAATLVIRYILETCSSVEEAKSVLSRVPVYMPYTFVIVDARGTFTTAYTGPDIETRFIAKRASTNHQCVDDWPAYIQHTQSIERQRVLESMLTNDTTVSGAIETFQSAPLWRTDYAHASGTLYIAQYRPADRTMELHWPRESHRFDLDHFDARHFEVDYQGINTHQS